MIARADPKKREIAKDLHLVRQTQTLEDVLATAKLRNSDKEVCTASSPCTHLHRRWHDKLLLLYDYSSTIRVRQELRSCLRSLEHLPGSLAHSKQLRSSRSPPCIAAAGPQRRRLRHVPQTRAQAALLRRFCAHHTSRVLRARVPEGDVSYGYCCSCTHGCGHGA